MKTFAAKFILLFVGYVWHALLSLIVYPYLIFYLGTTLDRLVLVSILKTEIPYLYLKGLNEILAATLAIIGLALIFWSASVLTRHAKFSPFQFIADKKMKPKSLQSRGPYGLVRHPMLLGYLFLLEGGAVFLGSPVSFAWTVPLFAWAAYEYAVMVEEKQLVDWFGEKYLDYRKTTPALFPKCRFILKKHESDKTLKSN